MIGTRLAACDLTSIFPVMTDLYDFNMTPSRRARGNALFITSCCRQKTIYFEPYRPITGELAGAGTVASDGTRALKHNRFNGDVQMIRIDGTMPKPAADPRGIGGGARDGVKCHVKRDVKRGR